MNSVILIHPPHRNSTDDRLDPPLGLLSIASHLRNFNINVKILDLSGKNKFEIPYADYYGITVYVTSIQVTKEIISECKKVNPNCKIILGGAHPTACPTDFPDVDHVVVGYGEVAVAEIVLGIKDGKFVYGKQPENLFKFPSYDLIDINSYSRKIGNKTSLPYLTSRGCPYKCSFCGLESMHKLLDYKVKIADADTVISQIRLIKDEFGIDSINFQDDIFTLNPERLFKILDELKSLNIKFRCMGRAGYDKEKVYEKLAESGCEQLSWGIESGSQYILNRMNKQATVKNNYDVIQWAKKYGINSRAFFIIGFPGETKETLEETKNFIIKSDPDQYFISTFVPYPGTDVWNNYKKYRILNITNDYSQFYQTSLNGLGGSTIDTEWLTREEFRELEIEFRNWIREHKPLRGILQDYEKKGS